MTTRPQPWPGDSQAGEGVMGGASGGDDGRRSDGELRARPAATARTRPWQGDPQERQDFAVGASGGDDGRRSDGELRARRAAAPRAQPWPGDSQAGEDFAVGAFLGADDGRASDEELRERLAVAVDAADAPDAVFAVSRHGRRTILCGGTAPHPPVPRQDLRYELGSASKTFTGLLLAQLIRHGLLTGGEPAVACLDPDRRTGADPVTLAHLLTHTAGLPALPADFYLRALPAGHTNPYARYPATRVIDAFLRHRARHRPGSRWRYSNFGVAVLGHAVAAATGTAWEDLLSEHVLRPLALGDTALAADGPDTDAVGHGKDGRTPVPAFDVGGFQAAGAVRATPHDLLAFLEAHLDPAGSPLEGALRSVRTPVLRRGMGHRHVHTMAWFQHPTDAGPLYFHGGATLGQQAFLGFRPDTGTALAAVCTRRFRAHDPFVSTAYELLAEPGPDPAAPGGPQSPRTGSRSRTR